MGLLFAFWGSFCGTNGLSVKGQRVKTVKGSTTFSEAPYHGLNNDQKVFVAVHLKLPLF